MKNLILLEDFGFVSVTGTDAQKFLQGYTTCDLETLGESVVHPGAICNIKGRMVCNFMICRQSDGFLMRLKRTLVEPTLAFLGKYIVFSKAKLNDESGLYHCYGTTTESADFPQALHEISAISEGLALRISEQQYEIWAKESLTASTDDLLWRKADLEAGFVWVDDTTAEEYIPQTFNLHGIGGISFDKGCYLGQEIVARMQYRGELKNRLHQGETSASLASGTKIQNLDGKNVGAVVSVAGDSFAAVLRTGETGYQLADGTLIEVSLVA